MRVVGFLYGGAPVIKEYAIGASARRGIPVLIPASSGAGLVNATTTGCDNMVGITMAAGTYATAQSGVADVEGTVKVCVNPDAIIEVKLSGGATEDTALTLYDVTSANTDGLRITTGDDFSSPTYDEGIAWGYDGRNVGVQRKITAVNTTYFDVVVAFPLDSVVGDNYCVAPIYPTQVNTITLTTLLTQARADVAVATNTCALRCMQTKGLLRAGGDNGRSRSSAYFISGNHIGMIAT